jgi:hypothetical protein
LWPVPDAADEKIDHPDHARYLRSVELRRFVGESSSLTALMASPSDIPASRYRLGIRVTGRNAARPLTRFFIAVDDTNLLTFARE